MHEPARPLPIDDLQVASSQAASTEARSRLYQQSVADARPPLFQALDHSAADPANEPVRLTDPPVLRTTPTRPEYIRRNEPVKRLAIPRIAVCRQVRGFDDVVEVDASKLRQGLPILIYVTLENYRSMHTAKGYRTLTMSTLEVFTADGDVVQRQPLGAAEDLVDVPRRNFFLTHQITIPQDLPPGNYVFELCVDDLLGHDRTKARVAVHVMEGQTLPDGTADTSKSSTRPVSSRR